MRLATPPKGLPDMLRWATILKSRAWSELIVPLPVKLPPQSSFLGSASHAAQEPAQSQPAAQTLTGTIVKDGGRYILKVSGSNTYDLDDQDRAQRYEGKQVKVVGTLSAPGNSFHVVSIELMS